MLSYRCQNMEKIIRLVPFKIKPRIDDKWGKEFKG
jgi:hypothetical protein